MGSSSNGFRHHQRISIKRPVGAPRTYEAPAAFKW